MKLIISIIALSTLTFFGCAKEVADNGLTIYSSRHYDIDQDIVNKFKAQTGIEINIAQATDDELISKLEVEGAQSVADIYWTAAVSKMGIASQKKLLYPIDFSQISAEVPSYLKAVDDTWVAVTFRARVIAYNPLTVQPSELSTYKALSDPKWKNRILIRSSNNSYNQALIASMLINNGVPAMKEWLPQFVANFARDPQGSDRDQARAVVSNVGDLAIMNTYYMGLLHNSEDPKDVKVSNSLKIFFPNQETTGTHINASAIALLKHGQSNPNATAFINFLLSEEIQTFITDNNYEYPVNSKVEPNEYVKSWGDPKFDTLDLLKLSEYNQEAILLMGEAGWL